MFQPGPPLDPPPWSPGRAGWWGGRSRRPLCLALRAAAPATLSGFIIPRAWSRLHPEPQGLRLTIWHRARVDRKPKGRSRCGPLERERVGIRANRNSVPEGRRAAGFLASQLRASAGPSGWRLRLPPCAGWFRAFSSPLPRPRTAFLERRGVGW